MTSVRRESITDAVRATSLMLEQHVDSMRSASYSSLEWRRKVRNVESAMAAHLKALDSAIVLSRDEHDWDPSQSAELNLLRAEAVELERRVYRMLARTHLEVRPNEPNPTESDAFRWSKMLVSCGTRWDVSVLLRASEAFGYDFLKAHAQMLKERLQRHDPLSEHEPTRVGAAVTEEDATLSEVWFRYHREDLHERYPHQFVAVTREGVVAVDDDEQRLASRVYALQLRIGRFWTYIGKPSLEQEAPSRDVRR